MTPYEDVQHLDKHGYWPNRTVPQWAKEKAEKYGVYPTSPIIIEYAYKHEIERLRDTLKQAKACLMNLQPENGPVAQQMQKMIHEIFVALGDDLTYSKERSCQ